MQIEIKRKCILSHKSKFNNLVYDNDFINNYTNKQKVKQRAIINNDIDKL